MSNVMQGFPPAKPNRASLANWRKHHIATGRSIMCERLFLLLKSKTIRQAFGNWSAV